MEKDAIKIVNAERVEDLMSVFGSFDENIKYIEEAFGVNIISRGNELKLTGDEESTDRAARAIEGLLMLASKGETIDEQRVRYLISLVKGGNEDQVALMAKDVVCITAKGKPIKAKTVGQQQYMKAIIKNTVTIGVGPAGTGKTYLAVAAAVAAFRERTVNRIILTRPAVEAGERLGFLPGDLQNKVDPYLRPLYDALYDMLGAETFQKYQERGTIEVAPLAYMRGRTLDDSFIILDEAQNTTKEQMKMFLTRLGFGSKVVITGDITQIDLPTDKTSGLKDALRVLGDVQDIAICKLTSADVVRHALVQRIIDAYEHANAKKEIKKPADIVSRKYKRKSTHE
jgi:phosphate starvation-inducible PhoH-like protein